MAVRLYYSRGPLPLLTFYYCKGWNTAVAEWVLKNGRRVRYRVPVEEAYKYVSNWLWLYRGRTIGLDEAVEELLSLVDLQVVRLSPYVFHIPFPYRELTKKEGCYELRAPNTAEPGFLMFYRLASAWVKIGWVPSRKGRAEVLVPLPRHLEAIA